MWSPRGSRFSSDKIGVLTKTPAPPVPPTVGTDKRPRGAPHLRSECVPPVTVPPGENSPPWTRRRVTIPCDLRPRPDGALQSPVALRPVSRRKPHPLLPDATRSSTRTARTAGVWAWAPPTPAHQCTVQRPTIARGRCRALGENRSPRAPPPVWHPGSNPPS